MLINPAYLFAALWIFVLFLCGLKFSPLISELSIGTYILVLGGSASFFLGSILESFRSSWRLPNSRYNPSKISSILQSYVLRVRTSKLWFFFLASLLVEIVIAGGLPGLGFIGVGKHIDYTEFGVKGVHGLVNAVFYSASLLTFARLLLSSSRKLPLFILLTSAYPLLTMSRQVMISLFLQYLLIYIALRPLSLASLAGSVLLILAILIAFGYLGDVRTGRDAVLAWVSPSISYPEWLPSGFLWVYLYLCTPINNVNQNIQLEPTLLPFDTFSTLIPSPLRSILLPSVRHDAHWELVSDTFNVSSLLQSLLSDFGLGGSIIFLFFVGLSGSYLVRLAHHDARAFFALIVVLHGIALSFFANLLFHVVFLAEITVLAISVSGIRIR